jgi:hypothetical protein
MTIEVGQRYENKKERLEVVSINTKKPSLVKRCMCEITAIFIPSTSTIEEQNESVDKIGDIVEVRISALKNYKRLI